MLETRDGWRANVWRLAAFWVVQAIEELFRTACGQYGCNPKSISPESEELIPYGATWVVLVLRYGRKHGIFDLVQSQTAAELPLLPASSPRQGLALPSVFLL